MRDNSPIDNEEHFRMFIPENAGTEAPIHMARLGNFHYKVTAYVTTQDQDEVGYGLTLKRATPMVALEDAIPLIKQAHCDTFRRATSIKVSVCICQ